jgi:predicted GIY-YIG superfamily endonuclease
VSQLLLLPDPRPLDQRLGRKFFLKAPRRPGVYLMRDAADKILYIGKAKDLKQRLNNYRNANPDRMPRRHLRLVREVARIEFEFCRSETAALQREKKLIRTHKPKFNRAGVWQGKTRFIVWRLAGGHLQLDVVEVPDPGWRRFGPLGANANFLLKSLSRLLWLVINPDKLISELPVGWMQQEEMLCLPISDKTQAAEIFQLLEVLFWNSPDLSISWFSSKFSHRHTSFERHIIESDLENLKTLIPKPPGFAAQFSLL